MKRNLVAHYRKYGSDKIYIVSIRQSLQGRFEVLAKWGGRGCKRVNLTVKGSFADIADAERLAGQIFNDKLKKGYVDIEDSTYDGLVTLGEVRNFLEDDPQSQQVTVEGDFLVGQIHKEPEPRNFLENDQEPEQKIVVCVNNLGLEHLFVVGEKYNATSTDDAEMISVTGMNGETVEVFAERFELSSKSGSIMPILNGFCSTFGIENPLMQEFANNFELKKETHDFCTILRPTSPELRNT